jgi:hypothetical protein
MQLESKALEARKAIVRGKISLVCKRAPGSLADAGANAEQFAMDIVFNAHRMRVIKDAERRIYDGKTCRRGDRVDYVC